MTVSAVTTATVRQTVQAWYMSLVQMGGVQMPGDVQSALQDICIEAQVNVTALPKPLQDLHDDIVERNRRVERGGYQSCYETKEVLDIVREALTQL
ncbi:MAG TPA: hypothetical protein VLG36_05335 [Candidatus Chromulinivoraceae bacterium]|nr:hypothetical protein [Candidatus Chromulinivoraceae bacterium]